jgi:UDP-2,3-diacylglucosamine pyrophosphatase LpxH
MTDQGWRRENIRTLFISDVHLGCKFSQGDQLLRFLDGLRPERVYLVGDFIDSWRLGRGWTWPPFARELIDRLSAMASAGTSIFYVAGNHDAFLRQDDPLGRVLLKECGVSCVGDEFVHETIDRRRLLVTHGDLFDAVERCSPWISYAMMIAYDSVLSANWTLSQILRRTSSSPYSLCAIGKDWVKRIVKFLSSFEASLLEHARGRNCDGVVCGHLHTPRMIRRDDMLYLNTGDWVENCTAIVEYLDGALELQRFYRRPDEPRVIVHPQPLRRRRVAGLTPGPAPSPAAAQDTAPAPFEEAEPCSPNASAGLVFV